MVLRGPPHVRFGPRVKLHLSMRKVLEVVTYSTEGEISAGGDFTSVLKTEAKFHPGANSIF